MDGSTLLNSFASEFTSKIGKQFQPVKGNEVLILSNGNIETTSFGDSHISALACETQNEFGGQKVDSCGVTFNDLHSFGTMMVVCPT